MVKVYSIALVLGIIGLIALILGTAATGEASGEEKRPWERPGMPRLVGALIGFGMGGMSAEFSPLDLSWPAALAIAVGAAVLASLWVRHAVRQAGA